MKSTAKTIVSKTLVSLAILLATIPFMAVRAGAVEQTAFKDVKAGTAVAEATAYLKQASIVGGYGDGTYRPDKQMSRIDAAKVCEKAFGTDGSAAMVKAVESYSYTMNSGMNVATANYFILANMGLVKTYDAYLNMEEYEFIQSVGDTMGLIPAKEDEDALVTRGEFAIALANAMKLAEKQDKITVNGVTVIMSEKATEAEKADVTKTLGKTSSESIAKAMNSWAVYFDSSVDDMSINFGTKTATVRDAAQLESFISRIAFASAMGICF